MISKKHLLVALFILIQVIGVHTALSKELPEPVNVNNSVEICMNSRFSRHDVNELGNGTNDQWLSNVLWAAGKAPITGEYRNIKVETWEGGVYRYHPNNHTLIRVGPGISYPSAFKLFFDSDSYFDTGVSSMYSLLSAVSQWNGTKLQLANCPKGASGYKIEFSILDLVRKTSSGDEEIGLTSELVAKSSDSSLPNVSTSGNNNFTQVIDNLMYTDVFLEEDLSFDQLSQILWAGYGCTPHVTYNNRSGLTVPSAMAAYFLTENIYLIKQDGVFHYHNRNPSDDRTTRDHRIENMSSKDVRDELKTNVRGLPSAPDYIILSFDNGLYSEHIPWAKMETGFVAGNMLFQASALDLGCYFTTNLTIQEKKAIRDITSINSTKANSETVVINSSQSLGPYALTYSDIVENSESVSLNGTTYDDSNHDIYYDNGTLFVEDNSDLYNDTQTEKEVNISYEYYANIPWVIVSLGHPAEIINITLEGYPVDFGNVNRGEKSQAIGNHKIKVGSDTNVNVDFYTKGDDFHSGGNTLGITNMTWNTINDSATATPMKNTYCPIKQNVIKSESVPMYYWISIPENLTTGGYTTNIYLKAFNSIYRYF